MKKFMIVSFLFVFLFASNLGAKEAVTSEKNYGTEISTLQKDNNFFSKIKTKVNKKINIVKTRISNGIDKINNIQGGLRTALILMVIGLIFIILAGPLSWGGIVYAVGAIFFLIGAILLLLEFL